MGLKNYKGLKRDLVLTIGLILMLVLLRLAS